MTDECMYEFMCMQAYVCIYAFTFLRSFCCNKSDMNILLNCKGTGILCSIVLST